MNQSVRIGIASVIATVVAAIGVTAPVALAESGSVAGRPAACC